MRIVMFVHSLRSCWNHGSAHFLRGIASELQARGHSVRIYEPAGGWSALNLAEEQGPQALEAFRASYPGLDSTFYSPRTIDLDWALEGAELVLVHEWTPPELVARIGRRRRVSPFRLLFHDTHHRAISDPRAMEGLDLRDYDGVLAFAKVLEDAYLRRGWAQRAWTWHQAADTRVFRPNPAEDRQGDLAWIGNWGGPERTAELQQYLFIPARQARLSGVVHGVSYPAEGRTTVEASGLRHGGWLPNHETPAVFARHRMTVHVPRRQYQEWLPGVPTMSVFEALACGIPLICAPWRDVEGLFEAGAHYLVAESCAQMTRHMRLLAHDPSAAKALAEAGRDRVLDRHTCAHRVDELLDVVRSLSPSAGRAVG